MEIDGGMVLPRARLQYELLTQRQVSMKFLHAAAFAVALTFTSVPVLSAQEPTIGIDQVIQIEQAG